jgi:hypothetical protein
MGGFFKLVEAETLVKDKHHESSQTCKLCVVNTRRILRHRKLWDCINWLIISAGCISMCIELRTFSHIYIYNYFPLPWFSSVLMFIHFWDQFRGFSILRKGLQLLVPLHTFECHICTECSQRIRATEAAVSNGSLLNTFKTPEVMNQFDPNISFSDPYWSSKFWRSAQYHLGHQQDQEVTKTASRVQFYVSKFSQNFVTWGWAKNLQI